MNDRQQLRESLWDLVYGLAAPEEEQALIDRIKSDPDAARLYAEVRLEADLVGQAAKVEDSSLVLSAAAATQAAAPVVTTQPPPKPSFAKNSRLRFAPAVLAALSTALLVLLAVGLLWPVRSHRSLARRLVAVDLLSDPARPAGLTRKVELRTYAVTLGGEFQHSDAQVQLRLLAADGRELLEQIVTTDKQGQATVELPGAAVEPGAKVEVTPLGAQAAPATRQDGDANAANTIVAELPVEPEPQVAYFLTSEPMVEEGKSVEVSLWNFNAFSAKPAPAEGAKAAIEEVEGLQVQEADTVPAQPGVFNAVVQVSPPQATPPESLAAPASGPPANPLRSEASRSGGASSAGGVPLRQNALVQERTSRRRALNQSRVARGYAQMPDASPAPTDQAGAINYEFPVVAAGQPVKLLLPEHLMGKAVVATASCRRATVATAVLEPAETSARRARNAQQAGDALKAQASPQEIVLELPPEADGLIEIALYDRSSQEPVLVEQRQVYREPLKQLQIEVAKGKERFAPGEQVALQFRVTDERGRPAANTRLGVRVWNESSLEQAEEPPVLLAEAVRNNYLAIAQEPSSATRFRLTGGQTDEQSIAQYGQRSQSGDSSPPPPASSPPQQNIVAGKELEFTDRAVPGESRLQLEEQGKSSAGQVIESEAATALGGYSASGSFANVQIAADPFELASNRAAIRQSLQAAAEQAGAQSRRLRTTIGWIAVVGGIALLVVVAAGVVRRAASSAALVPAGAIALTCLLLGFLWTASSLTLPGAKNVATTAAPAAAERETAIQEGGAGITSEKLPELALRADPSGTTASSASASSAASGQANTPLPPAKTESQPDTDALAVADARRGKEQAESKAETIAGAAGGFGSTQMPATAAAEAAQAQVAAREGQPQTQAEPAAAPSAAPAQLQSLARGGRGAIVGRAGSQKAAQDDESAPTALYFNPQLVTDAEGRVNIELVMPAVEAEYRVLIDALGQGRVGSQQDQLIIDSRPATKASGAK